MAGESDTLILLLVAIIFPPAAVAFISGCGGDLCLNFLLTVLGYLPGLFHAIWLVMKRSDANEQYGYKNWTYSGMGKYVPRGSAVASGQQTTSYVQTTAAAPPQGQYPAGGSVPPPPPPPSGQQPGGYAPPPQPPSDVKYTYQAPPQGPADQKVATDQKQSEYQAPVEGPVVQKAINVSPQPPPPPADQKSIG